MLKNNEYFDGKVKSISFESSDGPSTVGVMAKGTYEFTTSTYEYMTVINGELEVQFPGEDDWAMVEQMDTFEIEPNSTFKVRTKADVAYLCLYTETELEEFHEDYDDEGCGCGCGCD